MYFGVLQGAWDYGRGFVFNAMHDALLELEATVPPASPGAPRLPLRHALACSPPLHAPSEEGGARQRRGRQAPFCESVVVGALPAPF